MIPEPQSSKAIAIMETSALLLLGLRITSSFQTQVPIDPIGLYYAYLISKLFASLLMAIALILSLVEIIDSTKSFTKIAALFLGVGVGSAATNTIIAFLFALNLDL
jgi:hypothetical protein